jgi:hypothetical protein
MKHMVTLAVGAALLVLLAGTGGAQPGRLGSMAPDDERVQQMMKMMGDMQDQMKGMQEQMKAMQAMGPMHGRMGQMTGQMAQMRATMQQHREQMQKLCPLAAPRETQK